MRELTNEIRKVRKDFIYYDVAGTRDLAGRDYVVDFELTLDEVAARAMEGNPAYFNFIFRREKSLPELTKKIYYGHIMHDDIMHDDGANLGYVLCEDELEEGVKYE